MLVHSRNVPHSGMDNGDSHNDQDIELEGNSALDIHEETPIIAYLQTNEVLVRLTPKE
jgi:hypothetical protein